MVRERRRDESEKERERSRAWSSCLFLFSTRRKALAPAVRYAQCVASTRRSKFNVCCSRSAVRSASTKRRRCRDRPSRARGRSVGSVSSVCGDVSTSAPLPVRAASRLTVHHHPRVVRYVKTPRHATPRDPSSLSFSSS